jgi:hypothetical protein
MNEYQEQGYKNRREYLDSLAEDFGVNNTTVYMLASMLGASEDFDGLIVAIEDAAEEM